MTAIRGNKGEWSEVYAFLRLLADGKLYAADEDLNKIEEMFFPILSIIREENRGIRYEFKPQISQSVIAVFLDEKQVLRVPVSSFDTQAQGLLFAIKAQGTGRGSFEADGTEAFMRSIYVTKLKAPSTDKSDISMQVHDVNTGFEKVMGFSIKSELGMPPTLLNAGQTTNFIYRVEGLSDSDCNTINRIDTSSKIKDRMKAIADKGGRLLFTGQENATFHDNLVMIDSQMPMILAEMLIGYYSGRASTCSALTDYVIQKDPIAQGAAFYKHKVRDLLCAVALGMKPATRWDGTDEATGGYIIVKASGDVLAYHIYNRDAFRNYLLNSTKFESPSSSRYGYGSIYAQNGAMYIKLNLQVRFL